MFRHYVVFFLFVACYVECDDISACGKKEASMSYLDVAVDMITKVKNNVPTFNNCNENVTRGALDCADLLQQGRNTSGVYKIWPQNRLTEDKSIDVYCDMVTDGGGWTLIQRRGNFQRAKDYFYKDWKSYKEGFGDLEKDFWLGNDYIFALTTQKLYSARFDLKDVEGSKRYAQYDKFWIDDENSKYALHISDYSGDAGDSMVAEHNNQKFSTKDQDNDSQNEQHCAQMYKGGWWYKACHQSNLNGLYLRGKHESFADGVDWFTWKGYHESMDTTEIKVRPKSFRRPADSSITPM